MNQNVSDDQERPGTDTEKDSNHPEETANSSMTDTTDIEEKDPLAQDASEASGTESIPLEDGSEATPEAANPPTSNQEEMEKWKALAMRNQAELENFRKRMQRERADALRYANVSLIEELLPILDNFDLGLEAARAESDQSIIYQGMVMVQKQFKDFISNAGVKEIEVEGKEFDPSMHHAVDHEHSDEVEDDLVLKVVRKGYMLQDRLVRAANVIVSKGAKAAEESSPKEEF